MHPVAQCARAVAGWHTSCLTALGLRSASDVEAWRAVDEPPQIYFSAITLRPDTPPAAVAGARGSVCDSWQTLDLTPAGFRPWRRNPWFWREPARRTRHVRRSSRSCAWRRRRRLPSSKP